MSVLEEDMVSLVRSHYRKKSAPGKGRCPGEGGC